MKPNDLPGDRFTLAFVGLVLAAIIGATAVARFLASGCRVRRSSAGVPRPDGVDARKF